MPNMQNFFGAKKTESRKARAQPALDSKEWPLLLSRERSSTSKRTKLFDSRGVLPVQKNKRNGCTPPHPPERDCCSLLSLPRLPHVESQKSQGRPTTRYSLGTNRATNLPGPEERNVLHVQPAAVQDGTQKFVVPPHVFENSW